MQIKDGAFLTVKAGEALNTMTIGWATIGFAWRKPILMVMVRNTRHTYSLIEKAADFTVNVPTGDMKKEIAFCGTKSGRDVDKFKECWLKTAPNQKGKNRVRTSEYQLGRLEYVRMSVLQKFSLDIDKGCHVKLG